MQFCKVCGNLLLLEHSGSGEQQFICSTCPFIGSLDREHRVSLELKKKLVEDVLGGVETWKNVDTTSVSCPKCEHEKAYFMQIQTRSADEPSTIFYKCCNPGCNHQWQER